MKLRILLAVTLAAAVVAGVLLSRPKAPHYEFDAVFDTARGIVPGQLVKVAGSRVGTVEKVDLTPDRKASFRLRIDSRFGPFHRDASCKILPEGFISESFVQCEPGTPGTPDLAALPGHQVPTVPVQRTEASVQLQQVLDTFSLPVSERIRVLFGELGIASGGRGKDLNDLIRRANPALLQARRLLDVVEAQKAQLGRAIDSSDRLVAALADRRGDVSRFVERASSLTAITARKRDALGRSVRALPDLLDEVDASLGTLRTAADRLTPTARDLQAAAPELGRANTAIRALSAAGRPAFRALEPAAGDLRRAVPPTRAVAQQAKTLSTQLAPLAANGSALLGSLRRTGGIEDLQNFLYTLSTVSGTFDGVSHLVPINLNVAVRCFLDVSARGCRHTYDSERQGQIPVNNPDYPGSETQRSKGGAASSKTGEPPLSQLPEDAKKGLRTTLDTLLK